MSHSDDHKERDLVSLLSIDQRAELTLLIATATERMRRNITEIFDAPAPPQPPPPMAAKGAAKEEEGGAKDAAAAEKAVAEQPPGAGAKQSVRLMELKKTALTSFDTWSSAVLQRISEAVHSDLAPPEQTRLLRRASTTASEAPPPPALPEIYAPIPTPLTSSLPPDYPPMVLHALLLLLLSLERYDARSRVLLLITASSLNVPAQSLIAQETQTASVLVNAAHMSADQESKARSDSARSGKWWKVGLASVAGAVAIGVTGGLAAPLVAAGVGSVMGGIGLGGTVAAGYLGAMASSGAIVGTLFGAYGGKMTGEMMERYAAAVRDFAFIPVKARAERLRVTIGISGWLTVPEEVTAPWGCLNGNADVYALRWEMDALLDLGSSLQTILKSYAWGYVKSEIIKRTVFAALWGAVMWPVTILKIARVVDNPFSIAKHRSEKAGRVLADAIVNRAQGERPVTLVGFSLGARVIYSCLLSLAERGMFGLVENVVVMGAPVPADVDEWRRIRSVVAGRCVNVYSESDYILAFLYRTSSIQLGVAGLQRVGVRGVENVNMGHVVEGHLRYRYVTGMVLRDILGEDVEREVVEREERELRLVMRREEEREKEEGGKGEEEQEGEIDSVVDKAEKELEERRRKRAALEEERKRAMGE
ncbi:uncharacterized protein H6S33_002769 [Morchella sextelata]|uniref:uncharacterized protein n=1 Tax=Morchella sextelata TaxID=1174677 RepID=UPI001D04BE71|nr:uncharacterized protein H6S33_002769 [Morchella sextelata]KAH0607735.1 hypothetical protein H6S33_002769 [Morchella sextelata]